MSRGEAMKMGVGEWFRHFTIICTSSELSQGPWTHRIFPLLGRTSTHPEFEFPWRQSGKTIECNIGALIISILFWGFVIITIV